MATLRELFGRAIRSNGDPVRSGRVYITGTPGTYIEDAVATQIPENTVHAPTDGEGDFSIDLQVNEDGVIASSYELRFDDPDAEVEASFRVPLSGDALVDGDDPTPLDLSTARTLYADPSAPNYETIIAWLESRWQGPWDEERDDYEIGHQVSHANSAWISLVDGPTDEPSDASDEWDLVTLGPNQFTIFAAGIDGAFVLGTNIQGAPVRVPFEMPLDEIYLDVLSAPVGASWTIVTSRTPVGGAPEIIATTSVLTGQTSGFSGEVGETLLQDEMLTFECTSVGSADSGSDGRILLRGVGE